MNIAEHLGLAWAGEENNKAEEKRTVARMVMAFVEAFMMGLLSLGQEGSLISRSEFLDGREGRGGLDSGLSVVA